MISDFCALAGGWLVTGIGIRDAEWRLCEQPGAKSCDTLKTPDHHELLLWLRSVLADTSAVMRLRDVLARYRGDVDQLDDQEVIVRVAALLDSDRLRICRVRSNIAIPPRRAIAVESSPFPIAGRREPRPAPAKQPAQDPATFSGAHDPARQAAALSSAARTGAPFCEICERSGRRPR